MPEFQQLDNRFRRALHEQRRLIGMWSALTSNIIAEIIGDAGFDWILLDTEHSPNELPSLIVQLQALGRSDIAPVVRPAWNDAVLIKRLLDAGFYNFLIPFVQTADEARAAVRATRYPPAGSRGVSMAQRSNRFGEVPNYFNTINQNIAVMAQLETGASLAALDAICAVEGVDGIFIGPADLSASLGHLGNPGHPEVQQAMRRAVETCRAKGKAIGTLAPVEADARRYLEWGYSFVAVGVDLGLIKAGTKALAKAFRS